MEDGHIPQRRHSQMSNQKFMMHNSRTHDKLLSSRFEDGLPMHQGGMDPRREMHHRRGVFLPQSFASKSDDLQRFDASEAEMSLDQTSRDPRLNRKPQHYNAIPPVHQPSRRKHDIHKVVNQIFNEHCYCKGQTETYANFEKEQDKSTRRVSQTLKSSFLSYVNKQRTIKKLSAPSSLSATSPSTSPMNAKSSVQEKYEVETSEHKSGVSVSKPEERAERTEERIEKNEVKADRTEGMVERIERRAERTEGMTDRTEGMAERTEGMTDRTEGMAERTEGMAERTEGIAERIERRAERTEGRNKRTEGMAERIERTAERAEGRSERTEGMADRTEGMAERTEGMAERTEGMAERTEEKVEEKKRDGYHSDISLDGFELDLDTEFSSSSESEMEQEEVNEELPAMNQNGKGYIVSLPSKLNQSEGKLIAEKWTPHWSITTFDAQKQPATAN